MTHASGVSVALVMVEVLEARSTSSSLPCAELRATSCNLAILRAMVNEARVWAGSQRVVVGTVGAVESGG
jgi:hypothetical protein